MIGLPKTTEFNKRIPKQKFYENMEISPVLKKMFVEQIKTIYWRNKIAASTMNLAAGTNVTELEVFEVRLNSPMLDDSLLKQIDKEIPYYILFLLEYEGKYQAWIGYKEVAISQNKAFKVNGYYYYTEWLAEDDLPLKLEGMSVDAVYENFVRQIAGDALSGEKTEDLKVSVDKAKQRVHFEKQIAVLQMKVKKEKQFNKQIELNTQLKKLKKELEAY